MLLALDNLQAFIITLQKTQVGVWCAKTAWAYCRQALMVEFVNNGEETITKGVAKAISRHGDGVHDDASNVSLTFF